MNKEELRTILEQHKIWLETRGEQGCRAVLKGVDLQGANLTDANLRRAILSCTNLYRAQLDRTNLMDADFFGSYLEGADLWRANLQGANLMDANLTKADFEGANLTNAKLQGANLTDANLWRANLSGAKLPVKILETGKLYEFSFSGEFIDEKTKKWISLTKSLVCLISVNKDETLDFVEAGTGIIYRNAPNWLKYNFTLPVTSDMLHV
jgi:uncharacterized protein YjbI with pentapeptide repeats